jgi:histidinol dehydrogenase
MESLRPIPVVRLGSAQANALLGKIITARSARSSDVMRVVASVLDDISRLGDRALFSYTKKFEGRIVTARTVRISQSHIVSRARKVPAPLAKTIREASRRIRAYHCRQGLKAYTVRTPEAVLSQRIVPLGRVGLYVPGGRSPYPSSVLMNAIPALVAGVRGIAVVTPCGDMLDPAIAYALQLLKITEVYRVGGSQAIAALAFGTASIRPVDKIVGPGNAWVAAAKRLVYGIVDIDSIAGPSEVVVLADTSVPARWVALDMLAQAEHGSGDEIAVCITENPALAKKIASALSEEIARSPARATFARLPSHALTVFVAANRARSLDFVNSLAPEHLQIMTRTAHGDLNSIENSGAVFLGPFTPVALGDYFIGTNHVLPTGASARFASGLGVDDFQKRMSVAEANRTGLGKAAPHVSRFARSERFIHHAMSVEERLG